jgi:hypothetical protein
MPARLGPQHARAILDMMARDALDEARQHFLGRKVPAIICTAAARANVNRVPWTALIMIDERFGKAPKEPLRHWLVHS